MAKRTSMRYPSFGGKRAQAATKKLANRAPVSATRRMRFSKSVRGSSGAGASPEIGVGFSATPRSALKGTARIRRTGRQFPGTIRGG